MQLPSGCALCCTLSHAAGWRATCMLAVRATAAPPSLRLSCAAHTWSSPTWRAWQQHGWVAAAAAALLPA